MKETEKYIPDLSRIFIYPGLEDRKPGDSIDYDRHLRVVKVLPDNPEKRKEKSLVICPSPNASRCRTCVCKPLCDAPIDPDTGFN